MGDFRSLKFKGVYNSDDDNVLEDFYIPVLKEAVSYDRAVGFFSAAAFASAAQGLAAFCQNGGYMRLIIGAMPAPEDQRAIEEGYGLRDYISRITDQISEVFKIEDPIFENRLRALSWMIATNRLDIKLAIRIRGMFHEKVGILRDSSGNILVFEGSNNETAYALLPGFNYETMHVFPGWNEALREHYEPHVIEFERIWTGKSSKIRIAEFPDALKEKMHAMAQDGPPIDEKLLLASAIPQHRMQAVQTAIAPPPTRPSIPNLLRGRPFKIQEHQLAALYAWKNSNLRGILALATGAGKTITSIYGYVKIFEEFERRGGQLALCISVPYINLAEQWAEVLAEFSIDPQLCFGGVQRWNDEFSERVTAFVSGQISSLCAVVVNRTLCGDVFQATIRRIPEDKLFFIGDECHHQASAGISAALPPARYRLGLSATPDQFSSEANARLQAYYGEVSYRYDLRAALRDHILTPYEYHVEVVDLTEEEAIEYFKICEKISACFSKTTAVDVDLPVDPRITSLLARRSRLLGAARNKLTRLSQLLQGRRPEPFTLFYCGDGSVDDEDDSEGVRQIEAVSQLLSEHEWRTSRYTSRETPAVRRKILDEFRVGILDGLVAIRCLDEGVDIPACRTAYVLASSRSPRQFIQRRGRILRRSPGKEASIIFDFFVRLPEDNGRDWGGIEKKLFLAELARCAEFANLARNPLDAFRVLEPLLVRYHLTDRIDVVRFRSSDGTFDPHP